MCFRCGGREGECLDSRRVCDNFIDCEDASDESTAAGGGCFMKKGNTLLLGCRPYYF